MQTQYAQIKAADLPPLPRFAGGRILPRIQTGQAARAYAPSRVPGLSKAWKVWLVCGDCFLIGLSPVLVHMSKNAKGSYSFKPISINLLVEATKLGFAITTLVFQGAGKPGAWRYKTWRALLLDARLNGLLAVPAGLYAANNMIKFMLQLYFKPTTAKMLGNLKILFIAVLMKMVLKRRFTVFQWEALVLLVAGITVNQLQGCPSEGAAAALATAAILYTAGSIIVPSLASVFNELALKRDLDASLNVQNLWLYTFGLLFNLLGLLLTVLLSPGMTLRSVFRGHSKVTLLLVANNALQGILSSFFFKYADTILKKYSSTLATIMTGILSAVLFGHHLTLNFVIGVTIVGISMHFFFAQGGLKAPPAPAAGTAPGPPEPLLNFRTSPSMEHLQLRSDSVDSLAGLDALQDSHGSGHLSSRQLQLPV